MTEKTLKEIVLDNSSENTKVILDAMIQFPPNITRLALHVNKMDILSDKFNKWMGLSKLESLVLKSKDVKSKSFIQLGLNDKCGITDDHLRILTKYAEHYKSLEEVRFDRWPIIYKNQEMEIKRGYESGEFSKLSKAVLEKAGRFIKVIRRDSYDPFFNPMYSY
ncbi:8279_t:CDS:2 [Racocetra persica]|uniref:8279_t:CDS:1 n=1 Tax=Racocetra persica TaxID=160502 RepID=A0ACA9NEK3_9GLOM|nr:8279_t:CDS:2 [Racocetra persica]